MRSKSANIQSLWLAITLNAIPHGVPGGDTPPVPSSPAQPVHLSASANRDAPAPFTPPALPQPPGITHGTLKSAWEGQACECYQVGLAWEQAGDFGRAAKWYRLSADQGYALAQANLAMLYEHDQVLPDPATADVPWLMLPGGRIIGVSSIAAAVGIPMSSAYSASKAALESFYESLAIELRSKQTDEADQVRIQDAMQEEADDWDDDGGADDDAADDDGL